jgi:hypothetical protein
MPGEQPFQQAIGPESLFARPPSPLGLVAGIRAVNDVPESAPCNLPDDVVLIKQELLQGDN